MVDDKETKKSDELSEEDLEKAAGGSGHGIGHDIAGTTSHNNPGHNNPKRP